MTLTFDFLDTSYRYIKKNKYLCAMNKFDYTSVPPSLLYCDRRYLDDFDVDNPNTLNYHIEKAFDKMYGTAADYELHANNIFNTAYYICTIALADGHPQRRFGAYYENIRSAVAGYSDEIGVILSVVLIQIYAHKWDEKRREMQELADKITKVMDSDFEDISNEFLKPLMKFYEEKAKSITIPAETEFLPREITMKLLKDLDRDGELTEMFSNDEDKMLDFIFAIGKNEHEQKLIASYLQEKTHYFFSKAAEHKWFFEDIDRQIHKRHHGKEDEARINAEIDADIEKQAIKDIEYDYAIERVSKLEKENARLREEIKFIKERFNNVVTNEDIDSLLSEASGIGEQEACNIVANAIARAENEGMNGQQSSPVPTQAVPTNGNNISEQSSKARITIEEQSQVIIELQERIKNLEQENEELRFTIESNKERDKGLSVPDMAVILIAICYHLNQLPQNGRETLYPLLQYLTGAKESTAKEALRRRITQEKADNIAKNMNKLTPVIARIIKELPEKLDEENRKRLKRQNEERLK